MKERFEIEDKNVEITRVKWGEKAKVISKLVGGGIEKVFAGIFDKATNTSEEIEDVEGFNLEEKIMDFIDTNTKSIEEFIIEYTSLDEEALNEWDIVQVVKLLQKILEYNGINVEKVYSFFMKTFKSTGQIEGQVKKFITEIPK